MANCEKGKQLDAPRSEDIVTHVPVPATTGSAGTQKEGSGELIPAAQASPWGALPMARIVEGLAAAHARSMGGGVASTLIAGAFSQLSYAFEETKQELHTTRQRLDETRTELSGSKTEVAVLRERVGTGSKIKHLTNLAITVGAVLIGLSMNFYQRQVYVLANVLCLLGVLLILVGWFSTPGGAEK
jgi:hypothetical protein